MKKLISILMILFFGAGIHLQASKPIPSFKTQISNVANFQEKHQGTDYSNLNPDPKGKRNMIIVAQGIGPAKGPITIWVYSLDMQDVLGPFTIDGSGTITVQIDDRDWGTIIQCDGKCMVSVWTDDEIGEIGAGGLL